MKAQNGNAVLLHMNLTLADGSVAESTRANGKPAKFVLGDGSLSAAIESELVGLVAGDKKQFTITANDGFGKREPGLIQHLPKHQFPTDIVIAEGTIVAFAAPNGGEMPGVIRAVIGDSVTVDFNHPLAGEELNFDIEVLAVEA